MIHVVAGAVTDAQGRVLIAQRPPGKQLAGAWEFPGGKLDAGEARRTGLARELREELGIVIREPRPLIRTTHCYPFGEVLIDMWVVSRYDGEPRGLDAQNLRWCALDDLGAAELLPADRPIVRALRLPERLTERASPYYLIQNLERRPPALPVPAPRPDGRLVGAFCSTVEEGRARAADGVDFVVLARDIPESRVAHLSDLVPIPVYAAGISLEAAWTLGASGVADIGA